MTHYITTLLNDANNLTESLGIEVGSKIKWTDFSYNNDTSDSIGYTFDNDRDMYVQLFAFETEADAQRENLPMYGITACEDGLTRYDCWTGDDRSEALSEALNMALVITIKHTALTMTFEDLDALCLFVQNSIGLTDGGNAAMFWSGREDGIQELLSETKSKNVLDAIPEDILLEYVQSEVDFAMQQKHAKTS